MIVRDAPPGRRPHGPAWSGGSSLEACHCQPLTLAGRPGHLVTFSPTGTLPGLEGRFWVLLLQAGLVEVEDNLCTCFQGKQPEGNSAPLGFPGTLSQRVDINLQPLLFLTPSRSNKTQLI